MSVLGKRRRELVVLGPQKRLSLDPTMRNMQVERIQANRDAAMLLRQAKLRAMPLQRQSPQEKGFVDLTNATYAMDTTGTITLIATIAQGAGINQRIGKKIMYSSIQIRGRYVSNSAATFNDVAHIIVYDKRPTGALPAITDVLVSASANAFNNDDNTSRFQIVRRWDNVLMGNTTTPATGKEVVNADSFTQFRRPCVFKAAGTGAIGDIEEGALYAITVGVQAAGTAAAGAAVGYRVRFTEQ